MTTSKAKTEIQQTPLYKAIENKLAPRCDSYKKYIEITNYVTRIIKETKK